MKGCVPVPRVIAALFVLLLVAAACAKQPPAADPRAAAKETVVARVNGVAITEAALDETVERMRSSKHGAPASDASEARKRALDQMVIQELAVQEAARQGVRVTEKDLNQAMNSLVNELGHGEGFEAFLKQRHLTAEEVRSVVERRLVLERIYDKEVRSKVTVTAEDVRKEYDLNKGRYIEPEKAAVTDIIFSQHQGAEAMLKKAGAVLAAVKAGTDPRTLPSDDIMTVVDRDIDERGEPRLFGEARGLKEGEYSGLIETPDKAHILKLVKLKPQRQLTFEEAEAAVDRRLRGIAEMKRFAEWQEELRKNAVIERTGAPASAGAQTTQTQHP